MKNVLSMNFYLKDFNEASFVLGIHVMISKYL